MNQPCEIEGRGFTLRPAAVDDCEAIIGLIRELAEFEMLSHLMQATPAALQQHLFGPRPVAEAVVAELDSDGSLVGFALFFSNFSTFLGQPGLYLEDLYVQPTLRKLGIGKALLRTWARWPSSAAAAASNGACSTGMPMRSSSTVGWAPP